MRSTSENTSMKDEEAAAALAEPGERVPEAAAAAAPASPTPPQFLFPSLALSASQSSSESMAMNTPDRPMPAEQCTTIGGTEDEAETADEAAAAAAAGAARADS